MSERTAIGPGGYRAGDYYIDHGGEVIEFRVGRRRYWMSESNIFGGRCPNWFSDHNECNEIAEAPLLVWAVHAAWDQGGRVVRDGRELCPRAVYSLRLARKILAGWEADIRIEEAGGVKVEVWA